MVARLRYGPVDAASAHELVLTETGRGEVLRLHCPTGAATLRLRLAGVQLLARLESLREYGELFDLKTGVLCAFKSASIR